jgi:hypothetical protein
MYSLMDINIHTWYSYCKYVVSIGLAVLMAIDNDLTIILGKGLDLIRPSYLKCITVGL